jgi:hypothetical protein
MIAVLALIVPCSRPSVARAERTTPVQRAIAAQLRAMTGAGGPLENVKKTSIKASQIVQRGFVHLSAPLPLDQGFSLNFTAHGLERKLGGSPRGSFERLKVTGSFMEESYTGPRTTINKVTVLKAPREALE